MRTGKRLMGLLLALAMAFTLVACGSVQQEQSGAQQEQESVPDAEATYAALLFDTSKVHTVDIAISEADWADLRANPLEKTKYKVDVTIDGETVEQVSFATKGNTSLSSVAEDADSDRYSFKINFGKYVKGQTYHGLNKLNLNNIYADATYMKDYLSYEIFRQAGVDAPLVSYVWLTVNGEDFGLYVAIEDVSESYLERTNDGQGVLYKPESEQFENLGKQPEGDGPFADGQDNAQGQTAENGESAATGQSGQKDGSGKNGMPGKGGFGGQMPTPPNGMNGNNGQMPAMPGGMNGNPSQGMTPPGGTEGNSNMPTPPTGTDGSNQMPTPPDGAAMPGDGQMPNGGAMPGFMGFGGQSNGADLKYTDDEADSYSDIFDNNETDADDGASQRVIAALKALSEGRELETYLDTEEIIRYFAAHNFVLNYDSYTGNMLHNYYLYEKDGKLAMLPWDYNLAFGAFSGGMAEGDATALINTGIDTPLSGATEDARPMWSWIVSDETYLAQYHAVYDQLLTDYFESGEFEKQMDALYEMLLPYVEKDPSAFYTADEFKTAFATLKETCLLRAQSIRAQLDGTLSTKSEEQTAESQIDASGLNIRDMGSQGGGRNGEGGFLGGGWGGQGNFPGGFDPSQWGNGQTPGSPPDATSSATPSAAAS